VKPFSTVIGFQRPGRCETVNRSNLTRNPCVAVRDPIHRMRPFEQSWERLAGLPDSYSLSRKARWNNPKWDIDAPG
jgi:hypothetical protein